MRLAKASRDALIIIAITGVLLAVMELTLRTIFPDKIDNKTPISSPAYEHNNNYIVSLKPNIEKEFKMNDGNGDVTITWKTNSFGFRGEELGNDDALRIIVYGDSNVQARFTRSRNTYTSVLQDLLNSRISNAKVYNAGLVGAGPDQNYIRLSEDIDKTTPDIVIFHLFLDNDYGDIIRNRLFEISKEGKLVRTRHAVTKDQEFTSREATIVNWFNTLLLVRAINKLTSREIDVEALSEEEKRLRLMEAYERQCELEFDVYMQGKPRRVSHFADHYDIDIAVYPGSDSAITKITLMENILVEAEKLVRSRGAMFMVVAQPSVLDLTLNVASLGYRDLMKYEGYKQDNLTKPLKSICEKHALNCVHLVDNFLNNDPETMYIKNDNHWNDKGQRISAEATAAMLLKMLD